MEGTCGESPFSFLPVVSYKETSNKPCTNSTFVISYVLSYDALAINQVLVSNHRRSSNTQTI